MKKHISELDELDSIAKELEEMSAASEKEKTRLQEIATILRSISKAVYLFYKKHI